MFIDLYFSLFFDSVFCCLLYAFKPKNVHCGQSNVTVCSKYSTSLSRCWTMDSSVRTTVWSTFAHTICVTFCWCGCNTVHTKLYSSCTGRFEGHYYLYLPRSNSARRNLLALLASWLGKQPPPLPPPCLRHSVTPYKAWILIFCPFSYQYVRYTSIAAEVWNVIRFLIYSHFLAASVNINV